MKSIKIDEKSHLKLTQLAAKSGISMYKITTALIQTCDLEELLRHYKEYVLDKNSITDPL